MFDCYFYFVNVRVCSEPAGDPVKPTCPIQEERSQTRDARIRFPQTDHQGGGLGAKGPELYPSE